MKELVLQPNNLKQIEQNLEINNFIIGIKNLSLNAGFLCSIEKAKELINQYPEKNFFINLNKNYQNKDIKNLKKFLKEMANQKIAGILFCDFAIIELSQKYSFNLIWHHEHFVTNSETINAISEINGAVLATELNIKEIKEIRKNTNKTLFLQVFGYFPIYISVRKLIKNYCQTFQIQKPTKQLHLTTENNFQPIIEDQHGTIIYHSEMLNALPFQKEITKLDYFIINGTLLTNKQVKTAVACFINQDQETLSKTFANLNADLFLQNADYQLKGAKK